MQEFLILYFSLALRASQIDDANTNKIYRVIHLASFLYDLGNALSQQEENGINYEIS